MSDKPTGDDRTAGEDTSEIEKGVTLDTGQDDRNVNEEQPDDLHTPPSGNTRVLILILFRF